MTSLLRTSLHVLAALALTVAALLPWRVRATDDAPDALVVIIAQSTGLTDISLATLRRAFQGQHAEVNGKRLLPLNHPTGSPERALFDRAVLGLSPDEVGRFWINRRIRDEGVAPRSISDVELGLRVTASFPGAVFYLRERPLPRSLRVLTVNGVSPGAPGYLFPDL